MTPDKSRILAAVDQRFDEQIACLEALVAMRSLRNEETTAQDFVQAELERRGYAVSRFRTDAALIGKHPAFSPSTVDYNDSWNVVGRKAAAGAGGRSLAFNSHVDVVPPAAPAAGKSRLSRRIATATGSTAAAPAT